MPTNSDTPTPRKVRKPFNWGRKIVIGIPQIWLLAFLLNADDHLAAPVDGLAHWTWGGGVDAAGHDALGMGLGLDRPQSTMTTGAFGAQCAVTAAPTSNGSAWRSAFDTVTRMRRWLGNCNS